MRQSQLKWILDGVDVFKYKMDNPEPTTDSMNLGTAVHLLILQPHLEHKLIKLPNINGSTRKGKIFKFLLEGKDDLFFKVVLKNPKQEKDLFYDITFEEIKFIEEMRSIYSLIFADSKRFILLSPEDYDKAYAMAKSVFSNRDAMSLLKMCTHFEARYQFRYKEIDFNCTLDAHGICEYLEEIAIEPGPFIVDVKTTNIRNNRFEIKKEIQNKKYQFQAASYRKVFPNANFINIWVRNEAPYTVFPTLMSTELLDEGDRLFDEACDIYNDCLVNNTDFVADNRLKIV